MSSQPLNKQLGSLAAWLVLAFIAAAVGGLGSANATDFYAHLTLPGWAPPAWLFGPVWTLLYLMMGIASWLVWCQRDTHNVQGALLLYLIQLVTNSLWSWFFFAWQSGVLAFTEIIVLWGLVLATLVAFQKANRLAAALLIPYLAWVTFASALAWNAWQMNPGLLG